MLIWVGRTKREAPFNVTIATAAREEEPKELIGQWQPGFASASLVFPVVQVSFG